jgi:8-oxo-dGTP pyrophosphatase MutT (NUDIX family)
LEVLLLKRSRTAGFIPSAFVFPGGRVDEEDGAGDILGKLRGIDPMAAEALLDPAEGGPPALAFFAAAIRETFEETGLLLEYPTTLQDPSPSDASPLSERESPGGPGVPLQTLREQLLEGARSFAGVLEERGRELDGGRLIYIGHWVTPLPEPRRFDTRFFAPSLADPCDVEPDGREMVEALWLTPPEALERNRRGTLPLVFPTVKTLEAFLGFESAADALASFRGRYIPRCLPSLTPMPDGIRIDLDLETWHQ